MTASGLILLRPRGFGFDAQAARTNCFQIKVAERAATELRAAATREFDGFVQVLRAAGVALEVLEEPADSEAVDAVFLNNWFSTHACGTLVLYPMSSPVRRQERRPELVEQIAERVGAREVWDLTHHEQQGRFLEGTGSLVFDRSAKVAFAGRSERTDEGLVRAVCERLGYEPVVFDTEFRGAPVYHTNVLLSVADAGGPGASAVWCPSAVVASDRERVARALGEGGREVCELDRAQLAEFCGNVLRVASADGPAWVMSARARAALGRGQLEALGRILSADLAAIETTGGGSARCMVAEARSSNGEW